MIKNKDFPGSTEEFDIAALSELSDMAKMYVAKVDHRFTAKGQNVPDCTYSDFCLNVWEIMTSLVRFGYHMRVREEQISQVEEKLKMMKKAENITWEKEWFD